MNGFRRVLRVVSWVGLTLIGAVVVVAINLSWLAERMMTPRVSFAAETPPPVPNYANPASWSALPERADTADRAPTGASVIDQTQAKVDVFYVHPTSYVSHHWNAPTDDAALNGATDKVATGIQASAFNGCCAVYAPRYRQANGTAFYRPSADGDHAIDIAYQDVRRAFDAFNARRGAGRPFILAAHSQGSIVAERLLYEAITATPLRDQLVAAYLIGGRVTVEGLRERAPDILPCRAADDVHCVIAWTARSAEYKPTQFELKYPDSRERVCTNPLTWRTDGSAASVEQNQGAVFLETEDHAPRLGFADARCVGGTLVVSKLGKVPRDLPSRILDRVMGAGNYHPIEYQIFFMNLRLNATARASALLKAAQ